MQLDKKQAFVSELTEKLNNSSTIALLSFDKISVASMTEFRMSLKKSGLGVKVAKNTLIKRALDSTPHKELSNALKGTTLIVYSSNDAVSSAKLITEWLGKENFNLDIKCAVAMGQLFNKSQLITLSKLPGKNELFTGFLFALTEMPRKFLLALNDAQRRLCYALMALKEKKEKG